VFGRATITLGIGPDSSYFLFLDSCLSVLAILLYVRSLVFCAFIGKQITHKLEYGPIPNVIAALPNTGGALCSTQQSLADAHYWNAVQ